MVRTRAIAVTVESAPEVVALALRAFPSYRGRKFEIEGREHGLSLVSAWSGGSRSLYVVLPIARGISAPLPIRTSKIAGVEGTELAPMPIGPDMWRVPENGSPFGAAPLQCDTIPEGVAIVEHCMFCGKDMGLTVYVSTASLNRLALPAPVELTEEEGRALTIVVRYKSHGRRGEWSGGYGQAPLPGEYGPENPLLTGLRDRGFLKISKNGAISATIEGRNSAPDRY